LAGIWIGIEQRARTAAPGGSVAAKAASNAGAAPWVTGGLTARCGTGGGDLPAIAGGVVAVGDHRAVGVGDGPEAPIGIVGVGDGVLGGCHSNWTQTRHRQKSHDYKKIRISGTFIYYPEQDYISGLNVVNIKKVWDSKNMT